MKKQYVTLASVLVLFVFVLITGVGLSTAYAKQNGAANGNGNGKGQEKRNEIVSQIQTQTNTNVNANAQAQVYVGSTTNSTSTNTGAVKNTAPKNKCIKAVGHLIAPGWIKKNGPVSVDLTNCGLPPGIAKKIGNASSNSGNNGTTTNRNLPPVINGLVGPTSLYTYATGTWSVAAGDPEGGPLTYSVNWGDSGFFDFWFWNNANFVSTSTFTHSYANPGTYTVTFAVRDNAGKVTKTSGSVQVTNAPATSTATTSAPVISNIGIAVGTSSAPVVTWTTNTSSDSRVWIATSTPVSSTSTPTILNSSLVTTHSLTLSGLATSTTHYFLIGSQDSSGRLSTSTVFSISL